MFKFTPLLILSFAALVVAGSHGDVGGKLDALDMALFQGQRDARAGRKSFEHGI